MFPFSTIKRTTEKNYSSPQKTELDSREYRVKINLWISYT